MRGQFLIYTLHREPHNIIVAAVERRHTYISYPLLDAIGACLVKGFVLVYIMFDFSVRQLFECNIRSYGETALLLACR